MTEPPAPVEIFCCYSHKDKEYRQQLETQLSALKRQGFISLWHDQFIAPGTDWAKAIHTHLETASLILLLISADFINSDYCYTVEMERALKRHEANEARVIPIVVRPCDWKQLPIGTLQALPTDAKPITMWTNQDAAFTNIAAGIRQAIEDLTLLSESRSRAEKRRVILADLEDSNEAVRFAAAQALTALKDRVTIPVIINRLEVEPAPTTRYWLAYALGLIGGELALNALQDALATEKNQYAQEGIAAGLEELAKNCGQHNAAQGGNI